MPVWQIRNLYLTVIFNFYLPVYEWGWAFSHIFTSYLSIHFIKLWSYPIFFSVMLFVFFTLICKRLSHILVTNYLSFISFTNIFSEPVTWLLTCILIHKYFLFSYRQIYQTSHFGYASGTLFKKPSLHSGSWKYFLPILPIFWNFLSLI